MRLFLLFCAFSSLVPATSYGVIRQPASAVSPTSTLTEFYSEKGSSPTRGSASIPSEIEQDFAVAANDNVSIDIARAPAAARSKKKTADSGARLPKTVSDGFEYKVKMGKRVSTFWVIRRGPKFDLMFVNNAGSRTSLSLAQQHFAYLTEAATQAASNLRQPASDPKSCKTAFVRLHIVEQSKASREIGICLSAKSRTDEPLKQLGNVLASMVQ